MWRETIAYVDWIGGESDQAEYHLGWAPLTGHEGWQNNRHAFPVSSSHGLAWYEVHANFCGICLLKCLGLVRHIQSVPIVCLLPHFYSLSCRNPIPELCELVRQQ